jgi:hypothetical protein
MRHFLVFIKLTEQKELLQLLGHPFLAMVKKNILDQVEPLEPFMFNHTIEFSLQLEHNLLKS